jgi:hypothetical protein
MQHLYQRLVAFISLIAVIAGITDGAVVHAAVVQTPTPRISQALVSLFRVDIKINNPYTRTQLDVQKIPV